MLARPGVVYSTRNSGMLMPSKEQETIIYFCGRKGARDGIVWEGRVELTLPSHRSLPKNAMRRRAPACLSVDPLPTYHAVTSDHVITGRKEQARETLIRKSRQRSINDPRLLATKSISSQCGSADS